jgi:hypothetical protein
MTGIPTNGIRPCPGKQEHTRFGRTAATFCVMQRTLHKIVDEATDSLHGIHPS